MKKSFLFFNQISFIYKLSFAIILLFLFYSCTEDSKESEKTESFSSEIFMRNSDYSFDYSTFNEYKDLN